MFITSWGTTLVTRNTCDDKMCSKEIVSSYGWMNATKDNIVFDAGANIGATSRLFIDRGCDVYAYEPDADNFDLLKQNASDAKELHHAALVDGNQTGVTLWTNTRSENKGVHSILHHKGRVAVSVPALNFQQELDRIQPTHLKIDIEGYEHVLLPATVLPKSIRQMTIEVDIRKDAFALTPSQCNLPRARRNACMIIDHVLSQGFLVKYSMSYKQLFIDPKTNRCVLGRFIRPEDVAQEKVSVKYPWLTREEFVTMTGMT